MILYKALCAGISVIEQEESYTSRADVTAGDAMPVYGKEKALPVFSGKRLERGLYLCNHGYCINADCNGAANILRKAFPQASTTRGHILMEWPGLVSMKRQLVV